MSRNDRVYRRFSPLVGDTVLYQTATYTAWVAAIFSMVVAGVLAWNSYCLRVNNPLDSPELKRLTEALEQRPADESLKKQIRALDWRLRKEYLWRQRLSDVGRYLLLAGVGMLLLSLRVAAAYEPPVPMLDGAEPEHQIDPQRTRLALGISSALLIIGAVTIMQSSRSEYLMTLVAKINAKQSGADQVATVDEMLKQWPHFRGPFGRAAYAPKEGAPFWAESLNTVWKTAVPLPGPNSPIVWDGQVFLTGADKEKREVYSFDASSGDLLWRASIEVPGSPTEEPEIIEDTGFAASTAATDGRRVFAIFANGDLAGLSFDGKVLWARNLGLPENHYGHATSLLTYKDKLLVQFDQGAGDPPLSKLLAIDVGTGQTAWEKQRPVPQSWSTPILVTDGDRRQLITCADPYIIAYDPDSGEELWRADCLSGEIAPSPCYAQGMVFAVEPYTRLVAFRADGQGDVTDTHFAWEADEDIPDICSPATDGQRVYVLTTDGMLTAYDATTGEKVWAQDLEATFHASPVVVGDSLVVVDRKGEFIVIDVGPTYHERLRFSLGETVNATPAFHEGRIYVRGETHLYCLSPS